MARYRHYENRGKAGDFVFATTTCLDFAHLLRRSDIKDLATEILVSTHRRYHAQLHAYVVMSNHFHIVSRMPETHDSPWFMQRLKEKLSKSILPLLDPAELELLEVQRGLNRRSCWQVSFDSIVLVGHHAFHQKVRYTHLNPLRAKLVDRAEDYRWSSAGAYERGLWTPDAGLDLDQLLQG